MSKPTPVAWWCPYEESTHTESSQDESECDIGESTDYPCYCKGHKGPHKPLYLPDPDAKRDWKEDR